ncbi:MULTISPECIES: C13 family peptidase [unclassified Novosphingobium]|uniref:C13 family peptidase n=1 Tax=unclassified Novosphingobium TaxID=2644732 RepID=UPI001469E097|nr:MULTISPECIES: C13 family peptidase [unclassified Novosphingobium]NMN03084.1 hypothetical protein [Novosphingobium sp. SG919]NMN86928.1 hypothetical protein [Novosphingobium sp. SG916]
MAGTITFTPQLRDSLALQRIRFFRQVLSRRALLTDAVVLGVVWLITFFACRDDGLGPAARAASLAAIGMVVVILTVLPLCFAISRNQIRRVFTERRPWQSPQDINWTDQGISVRTDMVHAQSPWSHYAGWRDTRHGIVLIATNVDTALLPARAFAQGQREDLITTLHAAGIPRDGSSTATRLAQAAPWQPHSWRRRETLVPLMWLALAVVASARCVIFPSPGGLFYAIAATGAPVLAAMLGGLLLGRRTDTLRLALAFLGAAIVAEIGTIVAALQGNTENPGLWLVGMIVTGLALWIWGEHVGRPAWRRLAAIAVGLGTLACVALMPQAQSSTYYLSRALQPYLTGGAPDEGDDHATPTPLADVMWGMQPALLTKAIAGLQPSPQGAAPRVRAVAIAADGTQDQFLNEANRALGVMGQRYGKALGGAILLSNNAQMLESQPLATRANFVASVQAVAAHSDRARDWTFVYLVSHGGRDAALLTQTSEYDDLTPIDANTINQALSQAGIRRRVIVISACYAGSWIKALANPDTIVIAAARHDRTSFGCGPGNDLTYFGEAFLNGPFAQGASLQQSFDAARKAIARREAGDQVTPSVPQVFVGAHMQGLWMEKPPRD